MMHRTNWLVLALACLLLAPRGGMVNIGMAQEPPTIVGKIGDYTITADELEQRIIREARPYDPTNLNNVTEPPAAKAVLEKMLAEKAMSMEARKLGFLKRDMVYSVIRKRAEREFINKLLRDYLRANLQIKESEVQERMKADPKLSREQALRTIQAIKSRELLDKYYAQIQEKFQAKKHTDNFAKAAKVYERLLLHPKDERNVSFVRMTQIDTDMTADEQNLVLATYADQKLTLKDILKNICENMAPPSRPQNLNTAEGIDQFVNASMRMPLLVAEAKSLGLDKDEDIRKTVRDMEDSRLLGEMMRVKNNQVKQPDANEVREYFEQNKELFRQKKLMIDEIWCEDLAAAKKTRALLDEGKDFAKVKEENTLDKDWKPREVYAGSEGFLWGRLWSADPGDVVGPVIGFYKDGIKWRLVKILEKQAGDIPAFEGNIPDMAKTKVTDDRRNELFARFRKELLKQYPPEIYEDKIKDIDPLKIP